MTHAADGSERRAQMPAVGSAATARGVRRRRDDAGAEIEELDSATMRQSAHSHVQRKRRRTLADYLDSLSLGGGNGAEADAPMGAADDSYGEGDGRRRRRGGREISFFGSGGGTMRQFFFGRRRPMDRVFRHYAAVANHTASASDASGGELVVFRRTQPTPQQPRYVVSLQPYVAMTPRELDALSRHDMNKRVVLLSDDEDADSDGFHGSSTCSRSRSGSGSASSSASSPRFRALGVPHTDALDGGDGCFDDDDMDGSFLERKPQPYASGDISHSEWFLSDDDL